MPVLRVDEELELVPWETDHAGDLFAAADANRGYLRQWLPWVDFCKSVDDEREYIRRARDRTAAGGFDAGIWRGGRLVGTIGYNSIDPLNRRGEIGYWLAEAEQGKGVMTRCCAAVVHHGFAGLNLNRVAIFCATENKRSRAIPERLGFTLEGVYREAEWLYDHFVDLAGYGMVAREWARLQPGPGATAPPAPRGFSNHG
jgi:ribosomal-protein-serine acetyltransferase